MSGHTYSYFAPAKLNLFLHITGVRDNGMHNLQTLFQLLDYGDEIRCEARADETLNLYCNVREIQNADNLVMRAAVALKAASGTTRGADIYLHKHIPVAAGLGGGSSDAATTLHALNRLWRCSLNTDDLASIGATIGADIPVFIYGRSAWGEGVGDKLTPVSIAPAWYAVFVPPVNYTTAMCYADPELERNCEHVTMADYLAGKTRNVFEPVARRHTLIADWMDKLGDFAHAKLSGTGPGIYATFGSEREAHACVTEIDKINRGKNDKAGFFSCVTCGIDQSPLCDSAITKNTARRV